MRPRIPPPILRVPPPKVAAVLVLLMLGFGVVIGRTARNSVQDRLTAARPHVELLVHRPQPSGSVGTGQAEPASSAPEVSEAGTPVASAPSTSASSAHPGTRSSGSREAASQPAPRKHEAKQTKPATKLPAIRHVFVIMLSDEPFAAVFGPESAAHYLIGTLERKGALLPRYDAVAHEGLADEIALLSGQGPTVQTAAGCPEYSPLQPTGSGPDELVLGSGCVYPASTRTLPEQMRARHLTWRAYIGGIGEAGGPSEPCPHPAAGGPDPTAAAGASGPYSTTIDPIAYFAGLIGSPGCAGEVVGLARLTHDLARPALTPNFSYIAPSRCENASPTPCSPGAASGLAPADAFLKRVVPEILASRAYRTSGMLVITVDQAPATGPFADSSSCCGEPAYPNLPAELAQTPSGRPRGGGAVGALVLSPFIHGPVTSQEPFNHYSLLATIERLFGLPRLGYSALASVKPLEPSLFSETTG